MTESNAAAERAQHIRAKLAEELQTLLLLERSLKTHQGLHDRVRGDAIAVAIEHLRQAMDALELASKN